MYYFITNRFFKQTSAIELAQVKRQKIFSMLDQESTIVEIEDSFENFNLVNKLKQHGKLVNMFNYFQKLQVIPKDQETNLIDEIFDGASYTQYGNHFRTDDKYNNIQVNLKDGRVFYVDYLDHYGFLDRREYYKFGKLANTEFFSDDARVLVKQYYDNDHFPIMTFYYRGADNHQVALTMIRLRYRGHIHSFATVDELISFFFNCLVEDDKRAGKKTSFIIDRSVPELNCLSKLDKSIHVTYVFHTLFQDNGVIRAAYKPIPELIKNGIINDLICSTEAERRDLIKAFNLDEAQVYAIPVTYTTNVKRVPFSKRDTNKILLVSRISVEKNVVDAIKAVIEVRKKHPHVYMDILGYGDAYNGNKAVNEVNQLIRDANAESYIHLLGFKANIEEYYDTASMQLLTSQYEGFAMALLEGQEHGLPGIAYDVKFGPDEIIKDNITGNIVPYGDLDKLEKSILSLLKDSSKRKKFSKAAYKNSIDFSVKTIANKWKHYFEP